MEIRINFQESQERILKSSKSLTISAILLHIIFNLIPKLLPA